MAEGPRILHVVESWRPVTTGYTSRSWQIVRHQRASGIARPKVLVTSRQQRWGESRAEPLEGVEIVLCTPSAHERRVRRLRSSLLDVEALTHAIEAAARGCDIIHSHWAGGIGDAAARAANRLGLPFVAEIRFDLASAKTFEALGFSAPVLERALRARLERYVARADALVAASYSLARFVETGFPGAKRAVHVVPNGAGPSGTADGSCVRAEHHLDGSCVFGTTSSMFRYENLEAVIDTCVSIANGHALFVGDGPHRAGLERHAQRRRAPVSFAGTVPSACVPDHLAAIDVFAVPRHEASITRFASPIKVTEAMAAGRAILATATGDLPWLLGDERGVLVPPGDAGSFLGAARRLALEPDTRLGLGRRAQAFAREQLSWPSNVERYRSVYAEALRS